MKTERKEKKSNTEICPYIQNIMDDIEARNDWNEKDNTILEYRGGKRGKKNFPYKGAPNPIVNILDDITTQKTDIEISMLMNSPILAHFVPLGPDVPADLAGKAQKGFDTYLRYYTRFRLKKEVLTDTKNLRGFSVSKLTRTDSDIGVIPNIEPVDPKDCIVPIDTQIPISKDTERMVFILRLSPRQIRNKAKDRGWQNTKELLSELAPEATDKMSESSDTTSSSFDERSTLKIKEQLLGINVSDYANNSIVVWEVFHYATQWDVDHDDTGDVKLDEACVTYICPDVPKYPLKIKPWKRREEVQLEGEELAMAIQEAMEAGTQPETTKLVYTTEKPFPGVQHRSENKSLDYYDSAGIGHKSLDSQIIATRLKKKKLIWADYATNPMFENDGAFSNEQNVSPRPGATLPKGIKYAQIPNQPTQMDFDIDAERREAAARSGAGQSFYGEAVTRTRKLEKTATQQRSEDAKSAQMSSASVDRFNDPDLDMFAMLWEDLVELQVELPIIHNNEFSGFMPLDVYKHKWLIIPATSQKHLNPDIQFSRDMEAFNFAAQFRQETPMRLYEGLQHVLTRNDAHFSDILLQDPNEQGPGNQPAVYMILQQMQQMLKELGVNNQEQDEELENLMKLAMENADKVIELEDDIEETNEKVKDVKKIPAKKD